MKPGRRLGAGLALATAALAAVGLGRRAPGLLDAVPAYRQSGPAGARVVIIEYSDFQCSRCAQAHPFLKELLARYEGKVRLVFRHFPLTPHKWAPAAARAAESAGRQGRFWDYADALYAHQKEWSEAQDAVPLLRRYAADLGLDPARFAADMDSPAVARLVQEEKKHSESVPIAATPTFFVNRRVIVGESQLQSVGARFIERELEP